ncbi:MAG: D-alanyl-D-alanine carboxypeptidase family protein [Erysipelotrichaceae bacterium]|nr:D-alanyl-D-alanine carboxypeptidase family protein [Erysipelotrichaceae bacterium]
MTNSIGDDVEVEQRAYDAYLLLKEDLEKEGIFVDLDSARRSIAAQQQIVDDFTEKYGADYTVKVVATPGFSEHHTGLVLDLYLIIDGVDVVENEDMSSIRRSGRRSMKSWTTTASSCAIWKARSILPAMPMSLGISVI